MIRSSSNTAVSIRATGTSQALQSARDFAGKLGGRLGRFADAVFRAWGARRLAREVQHWPDHRLKDLGLSRADVSAAIEGLRRPYLWEPDCDPAKLDASRFGH